MVCVHAFHSPHHNAQQSLTTYNPTHDASQEGGRKADPVPFDPKNDDIKVSALDPGIRAFNTVFDNRGTVTEMAPKDIGRISRLCTHADKLQSHMYSPEMQSRKRCRLRKAWLRLLQRIRFIVRDVHPQVRQIPLQQLQRGLRPRVQQQVHGGNVAGL